ncbi:alpha/beta fold hydrolase [Mycobacterium sp.]|uniref:alpha/beta fold hydrolase n=1 Tax=Mycobacterium sp. TaxID=1785 RepID=UPI003D09B2AA
MNDLRYMEMHGERVAYREAGNGEAIVLLHGMAGSSETWRPIIPQLAERYRVVAPDLLGHGHSAKPRTDYSLGAFAAGLRDLLDELGIRRATVVGHSLGGGIAMQFLYQHPEYCRRLVLVSSGGLGPDVGLILKLLALPGTELVLPVIAPKFVLAVGNRIRAWLSAVGVGSPQTDQMWVSYSSLSDPATRAAFLRTLRSVIDHRGQSVSGLNRLRLRMDVPTLLIWGDRDTIIPIEHGTAALAIRSGSRMEVLPGLGHFAHVQSPTAVVNAIEKFINSDARVNDLPGSGATPGALFESLEARRKLEVAIGVLMGWRGCSQDEAVGELAAAAKEMQVDMSELGRALVDFASGNDTSPYRPAVARRWRHLLALRGLDESGSPAKSSRSLRIRYGPENQSVIC